LKFALLIITADANTVLLMTCHFVADNRHVRVFLTYTYDNKQHMKNVLHLCECLKKNNFSVGLDARESHLLREHTEKKRWHDMRYDKVGWYLFMILAVQLFVFDF